MGKRTRSGPKSPSQIILLPDPKCFPQVFEMAQRAVNDEIFRNSLPKVPDMPREVETREYELPPNFYIRPYSSYCQVDTYKHLVPNTCSTAIEIMDEELSSDTGLELGDEMC
jgi:hypothetical protein